MPSSNEFVLGIDLGSDSLGWAAIKLEDGQPAGLLSAGVRIYEAGMEGDLSSGREESRNKARRDARQHRRQAARRARRLSKIARLLQRNGLLAAGDLSSPVTRQEFFNRLDAEIRGSAWFDEKRKAGAFPEPEQTLPYVLRCAALDEPLEPHFLGRAVFHLAQRRGFASNRKSLPRKDEDQGKVKSDISELRQKMKENGARTLGEYFARFSPSEQRIRHRWTARDMYQQEFEAIWTKQALFHPGLLIDGLKKKLFRAIFFQRPLWFPRGLIGRCELEPERPRAPMYLPLSQRFRLLQTVNNLSVFPPGQPERPLTPEERGKLIEALENGGDLTFAGARKLLDLPKRTAFNLERGGETRLPGNRTNSDLYSAFGDRWSQMSLAERDRAIEDLHSIQKPETLKRRSANFWKLNDQAADAFANITLEPDYSRLSPEAIQKVMPLLEEGVTYAEARRRLYPEKFQAQQPLDVLPPVLGEHATRSVGEIRNPAVVRSLTELRKVVNALVRTYGKPSEIHVELARELRKPKKARQRISEEVRDNRRARENAEKRIAQETGIEHPSRDDIRKVLLAEECRWECPYTGKPISMRKLVGPEPEFHIEHIIPFSRSLDNSFLNLTLCHAEENARKHDRTPYETYSSDPERYEEICDRVRRFQGDRRTLSEKLRRFRMTPEEVEALLSDFTSRRLNDTAYASRLAAQYLGLLHGGANDADHRRRVQVSSGPTTAYLRSLWQLNAVLNDGPTEGGGFKPKSRDDHRHHAVDAIAIALTSPATIKMLSDAAQRAPSERRRRFASLQAPWPDFVDSVRAEIARIVVSHRVSKKVSGPLHEETIYAFREEGELRVRKPLSSLTKSELGQIADPGVAEIIRRKLAELGASEPSNAFANDQNLPCFETGDARRVPIKKVRIVKKGPSVAIGTRPSQRRVHGFTGRIRVSQQRFPANHSQRTFAERTSPSVSQQRFPANHSTGFPTT